MNGELFKTLGTCCSLRSGQTFKRSLDEYPKGDVTVLLPKDIVNKEIADTTVKVAPTGIAQLDKHILKKGEIIVVNKGTRFSSFLYDGIIPNVVATTAFYVITPGKELEPEYLYWYLNQDEAKTYLFENTHGSVIPTITKTIVAQLPIPIIPLHAQKHILKFIEKARLEQELLKELSQKKEAFCNSYTWEYIQTYNN